MKPLKITDSSHIKNVDYDPTSQTAQVTFSNKKVYHYFGVHPREAQKWSESDSAGKFFHSSIKNKEFKIIK